MRGRGELLVAAVAVAAWARERRAPFGWREVAAVFAAAGDPVGRRTAYRWLAALEACAVIERTGRGRWRALR